MIPVKEEELPGFQELTEQAQNKITEICPGWTNFNPADSGMAIVELFAYMTELQQFHAQQTGPAHTLAFLHLLGTSPEVFLPSRVYAEKRGSGMPSCLLAGTKASVEALVWEAEETVYMERKPVLVEERNFPFYPFGESPKPVSHYDLQLERELEEQRIYTVYFDVADNYPVARNPIEEGCFVPLVELWLEYYDGDGYCKCEMIRDSTSGLLQTGTVQFRFAGKMRKKGKKYCLRLCVAGEYDTAPLLQGISFHMVPLVQRDTQVECRDYVVSVGNGRYVEVTADTWNGVCGETAAYGMRGEAFYRLTPFSSYVLDGLRYFVFSAEDLFAEKGRTVIRLVSVPPGLPAARPSFEAAGQPGQQFFLPDENVLGTDFSLWVEEKKGSFVPWKQVADLAAAGGGERCYVLDEKRGVIKFGDGIQGMAPKGKIEVTGYALCAGRAGNIQKNQKLEFTEEGCGGYLYNPQPGTGGRNPETVDECIARYRKESAHQERVVTREDYERMIRRTPGLRIKKVQVFSSPAQDNCLEAVVEPCTNADRVMQTDVYERNILRFMEKKRLLGTGLIIRKPLYVRITLQLEVLVKSRFPEAERAVEEAIEGYFDRKMDFGKTIVYSKLYGYIESLAETAGICELSLHTRGRGSRVRDNGDVEIPPHGIARLGEMKIQCMLADKN